MHISKLELTMKLESLHRDDYLQRYPSLGSRLSCSLFPVYISYVPKGSLRIKLQPNNDISYVSKAFCFTYQVHPKCVAKQLTFNSLMNHNFPTVYLSWLLQNIHIQCINNNDRIFGPLPGLDQLRQTTPRPQGNTRSRQTSFWNITSSWWSNRSNLEP